MSQDYNVYQGLILAQLRVDLGFPEMISVLPIAINMTFKIYFYSFHFLYKNTIMMPDTAVTQNYDILL